MLVKIGRKKHKKQYLKNLKQKTNNQKQNSKTDTANQQKLLDISSIILIFYFGMMLNV